MTDDELYESIAKDVPTWEADHQRRALDYYGLVEESGWASIPPDNDGYGAARHVCDEEECQEWLRRFAHLHGVEI